MTQGLSTRFESVESAREQRRRRLLILTIGALLLLAMSPIFGHHIGRETDVLFGGRDHLGAICLIALHHLAEPVHLVFHVLFIAGIAYAVGDRVRAWRFVSRTLGLLPTYAPLPRGGIAAAARAAGLRDEDVQVAPGLPTPALTVGWLRPADLPGPGARGGALGRLARSGARSRGRARSAARPTAPSPCCSCSR